MFLSTHKYDVIEREETAMLSYMAQLRKGPSSQPSPVIKNSITLNLVGKRDEYICAGPIV